MEDRNVIHNRILGNIKDSYDKSVGSFFYDNTKAAAIEFENTDKKINEIKEKLSIENSIGDDLEQRVKERAEGMTRKKATYAIGTVTLAGQTGSMVKVGDLVASDTVNFTIQEEKTIDETGMVGVTVKCEKAGGIGNVPSGAIKYFPVTLQGIEGVTNNESLVNGYEAENDESLLQRYYEKIRTPAISGNRHHYRNWAKEIVGVGDAKVIPLWGGRGTVKVIIIDANKTIATQELVTETYDHIEENRPIGATITVVSAVSKAITINVKVKLADSYTMQTVQEQITKDIEEYRREIAFGDSYVSYAAIGNIIFNTKGIIDYSDLKLNNLMQNITLLDEEIPKFTVGLELMI